MSNKKGNDKMATHIQYIEKNKDKIRKIAEANTKKNKNGLPVISKDDPWRNENEWDELYQDVKDKNENITR